MPVRDNRNIDYDNAARVLEAEENEERQPEQLSLKKLWQKGSIVFICLMVIAASFALAAMTSQKAAVSNSEVQTVQNTVSQLQSKLNAKRQEYDSKLADTDVKAYAEDKLGMIPAENTIQITLTQIPDEAD